MSSKSSAVSVLDYAPEREEFLADVLEGLSRPQKAVSSKYFYDQRGSEIFDKICEADDYYPTRTELAIMRSNIEAIIEAIGRRALIIEYGSGSSLKTRTLLDHVVEPAGYAPLDISREHLSAASEAIAKEYPHLSVYPICADFTGEYELPDIEGEVARRVVYFPGSTIGNFVPEMAFGFLRHIARVCAPNGAAIVGIDLQKPVDILEAAYNDSQGVTAAFNLNMLVRINRELGGNFNLDRFAHKAFYNRDKGRIEMHIESLTDQKVIIGGRAFVFRAGETIHTEYSHKFTIEGFADIAASAGLNLTTVWTDEANMFAVVYLTVNNATIAQ